LTDEPYLLSFDQIASLTDYQIYVIYYKDRNKDGIAKPLPDPVQRIKKKAVINTEENKMEFFRIGLAFGKKIPDLMKEWDTLYGTKS
jgi:hypothetical protein